MKAQQRPTMHSATDTNKYFDLVALTFFIVVQAFIEEASDASVSMTSVIMQSVLVHTALKL